VRAHPEQRLQTQIAAYLRAVLKPPVWFTAIPAGGGGELRGKILKGMGYKAGTPDMLIIDGGRAYWGEVKAEKGVLSIAQGDTIPALKRARCPVAIWRSIDDVAASLAEWGIPTREAKRDVAISVLAGMAKGPAQEGEDIWPANEIPARRRRKT
jgi:hypothetical protein